MKEILKWVKQGFIVGFTTLVIILSGTLYGAWENISKVTPESNLSSNEWNKIVDSINFLKLRTDGGFIIPTGLVSAFYDTTCPEGWSKADGIESTLDLRGEFIRGLDEGRGIDTGRILGSYQYDTFQGHGHLNKYSSLYGGYGDSGAGWESNFTGNFQNNTTTKAYIREASDIGYGEPRVSKETRPRNIALLYCIKN